MIRNAVLAALALCVFCCTTLMAAQIGRPTTNPNRPVRVRVEPCWQQVGIAKSAIEERAAVARETKMQVEAVCADSSLTPQQRQQKIREIRMLARQKTEALITPQQQQALTACQKERAASHPAAPAVHHASLGPCGEPLPATRPNGPPGHHEPEQAPAEEESPPQR